MALENDFVIVARRALKASNVNRKLREKSAFWLYHAFESIGCALATKSGKNVGQNTTHANKLKEFSDSASSVVTKVEYKLICDEIATLANLRNKLLYPTYSININNLPENAISDQELNKMQKDITSIVKIVEPII